jgi:large subunit ribosomal protein L29
MKKEQMEELRVKTEDELTKMVLDLKKQEMEYRFAVVSGQAQDTDKKRRLRKQIAVIKTILAEKKTQAGKTTKAPAKNKAAAAKKGE